MNRPSSERLALLLNASVLALGMLASACGATLKDVTFNVNENGKQVAVKKMYTDGFGGTAATQAFEAVQKGDMPTAFKILEGDVGLHPTFAWNHYDLGILHETQGSWEKAEVEMKEAIRIEGPKGVSTKTYNEELAFIVAHKPK